MNLNRIQKLVFQAVQENPGVQNDDAQLIAAVWRIEGWSDNRSLEDNIKRVSRPDSITRRRRELFNMGVINYTDEAHKRRMEAMKNEQELAAQAFDRFMGMSIQDELDKLTIKRN